MTQRLLSAAMGAGAAVLIFTLVIGGSAFAQTDTTGGTSLPERFLDRLAENLGLSRDELDTTIEESGNQAIDEAVESGELTEEQAERYRERIASGAGVFGFGGPRGGFGGHFGGHGMLHVGANLDTIAETLGMTTDELAAELESGATLSEIITAQGSSVAAVVDALVADARAQLDEAVAAGRITQEQADEMLANYSQGLTEQIENGAFGPGCPPGADGRDDSEEATPEETSI